jgi:hypothetical protein
MKLRPCPHCSGKFPKMDFRYSAYEGDVASTWVECDCGGLGRSVKGHDEVGAAREWNKNEIGRLMPEARQSANN